MHYIATVLPGQYSFLPGPWEVAKFRSAATRGPYTLLMSLGQGTL